MTEHEKIWQYLDSHRQEFLDYWAAHLKDASQVELVAFDNDKMKGVLMSFDWQGVKKVVAVTPENLLAQLAGLDEAVRQRCLTAAQAAEDGASLANTQGNYAKAQGNRVDSALSDYTSLKEQVTAQGNTAEAQGTRAQGIYDTVSNWFTSFKSTAEAWYAAFKSECENWLLARKTEWTVFYTDGVVPEWANLKGQAQNATQAASDAASLANEKASLANSKAGEAELAAALATRNAGFAQTEGSRAKGYNDHPWALGDDGFIYVWNENTDSMVKTNKMIISFNDLTESQRQSMIDQFYAGLVFASKETCETIVEELT